MSNWRETEMSEILRRERLIWLAGLLSTDGNVRVVDNCLVLRVLSAEPDWLRSMKQSFAEVGIETSVDLNRKPHIPRNGIKNSLKGCNYLYIHKGRLIARELLQVSSPYLMPRKRQVLRDFVTWLDKKEEYQKQAKIRKLEYQTRWRKKNPQRVKDYNHKRYGGN